MPQSEKEIYIQMSRRANAIAKESKDVQSVRSVEKKSSRKGEEGRP